MNVVAVVGKVECDTQQLLLELARAGALCVAVVITRQPCAGSRARAGLWSCEAPSGAGGCSCSSCKTMWSSASDKRRQNGAEVVIVSPPMPLCKVLHIGACGDTMAVIATSRAPPSVCSTLAVSLCSGAEYATTRAPGGSVCAGRYETGRFPLACEDQPWYHPVSNQRNGATRNAWL